MKYLHEWIAALQARRSEQASELTAQRLQYDDELQESYDTYYPRKMGTDTQEGSRPKQDRERKEEREKIDARVGRMRRTRDAQQEAWHDHYASVTGARKEFDQEISQRHQARLAKLQAEWEKYSQKLSEYNAGYYVNKIAERQVFNLQDSVTDNKVAIEIYKLRMKRLNAMIKYYSEHLPQTIQRRNIEDEALEFMRDRQWEQLKDDRTRYDREYNSSWEAHALQRAQRVKATFAAIILDWRNLARDFSSVYRKSVTKARKHLANVFKETRRFYTKFNRVLPAAWFTEVPSEWWKFTQRQVRDYQTIPSLGSIFKPKTPQQILDEQQEKRRLEQQYVDYDSYIKNFFKTRLEARRDLLAARKIKRLENKAARITAYAMAWDAEEAWVSSVENPIRQEQSVMYAQYTSDIGTLRNVGRADLARRKAAALWIKQRWHGVLASFRSAWYTLNQGWVVIKYHSKQAAIHGFNLAQDGASRLYYVLGSGAYFINLLDRYVLWPLQDRAQAAFWRVLDGLEKTGRAFAIAACYPMLALWHIFQQAMFALIPCAALAAKVTVNLLQIPSYFLITAYSALISVGLPVFFVCDLSIATIFTSMVSSLRIGALIVQNTLHALGETAYRALYLNFCVPFGRLLENAAIKFGQKLADLDTAIGRFLNDLSHAVSFKLFDPIGYGIAWTVATIDWAIYYTGRAIYRFLSDRAHDVAVQVEKVAVPVGENLDWAATKFEHGIENACVASARAVDDYIAFPLAYAYENGAVKVGRHAVDAGTFAWRQTQDTCTAGIRHFHDGCFAVDKQVRPAAIAFGRKAYDAAAAIEHKTKLAGLNAMDIIHDFRVTGWLEAAADRELAARRDNGETATLVPKV